MKIFCSSSPKNLAAKLAEYQLYATVEAEYGDDVVAGSTPALTLAHHGSRKENPNPCLRDNIPGGSLNMSTRPNDPAHDLFVPIEAIGLSHIDLDALGGTAALMGKKPAHESFWRLAAHIDSNGPHRAADFPLWDDQADNVPLKAQYYAYCAWAREKENQYWPPKDGSVEDVTERIERAIAVLDEILNGAEDGTLLHVGQRFQSLWIAKGIEFEKKLAEDESRCLLEAGRIRVFAGDVFCSAFYRNADGTVADATVSYGTKSGAITLAFEDGGKKHNATEIMQMLFGSEAGGHAGIAGSPRGKRMDFGDLAATVLKVRSELMKTPCSLAFLSREIFKKDI